MSSGTVPSSDATGSLDLAETPMIPAQTSKLRTYPRKRAVTACETCRAKKIKCGNQRPRCASCVKTDLPCSYDPRLSHSSFDPASLLILEKLDETLDKLDNIQSARTSHGQNRVFLVPPAPAAVENVTGQQTSNAGPSVHHCFSDSLEVPTGFATADHVLSWPVFGNRRPAGFLSHDVLAKDQAAIHSSGKPMIDQGSSWNQSINETEIPRLVERFLEFVHIKNPILDAAQLRTAARRIAEDGIDWHPSTCIVLLACALGSVGRPFEPSQDGGLLSNRSSAEELGDVRHAADAYYQLARRRSGLLEISITAGQCHVLSGIYLMYTLRPLQAWLAFHQAGSTYSLYLKRHAAFSDQAIDPGHDTKQKRLEQRLYWTVLKSECELREVLDLPQSDLCKLSYPYLFPSPPTPLSPVRSPEDAFNLQTPASSTSMPSQMASNSSVASYQQTEEQSWFYYLSEIALRRIQNRVLNAFYRQDPTSWAQMNVRDMISIVGDIETQLNIWKASLPAAIGFDDLAPGQPLDELRCVTRGRSLCIRSLLYRPFVYCAVHSTPNILDHITMQEVQTLSKKGLLNCLNIETGQAMTHRHHGTWYGIRQSIVNALMLLAAKTIGNMDCTSPQHREQHPYDRAINVCVEKLRYWEVESPDAVAAREVIEEIYAAIS